MPESLWRFLRSRYLRRVQSDFASYTTRQRFGGEYLQIEVSDPLAEAWYAHGCELSELRLLEGGRLKRGALVFNLGAHQGIVALRMAQMVGPEGRVIALEPNGYHADCARRNQKLNGIDNLVIDNAAICGTSGVVAVSNTWEGQLVGMGETTVPATTVDDLAEKYGFPSVLYIDVEGFECDALAGARRVLERRPDLKIEVHPGCGLERQLGSLDLLLSYLSGYRLIAVRPASTPKEADLVCAFHKGLEWTRSRFYLIALARDDLRLGTIPLPPDCFYHGSDPIQ